MNIKITKTDKVIYVLKVILGAALFGVGIQWFYRPAALVSGGITGVSMIINYLTNAPIGVLIIAFNIPLFIFAMRAYGLNFVLGSIFGMLASSVFIDLLSLVPIEITTDPILAAIYGGMLCGLGIGLIFSAGATAGGTGVMARLIRQKMPYFNIGTFVLVLDALVITVYAIIFRMFENAMYSAISLVILVKMIDIALYGFSQAKLCYIISEHSDKIKETITEELRRGVTLLKGAGAYSGSDKQVLFCVVKRHQIVEIKKIIKSIDKTAFVIVTDARDVFGRGFGDIMVDD